MSMPRGNQEVERIRRIGVVVLLAIGVLIGIRLGLFEPLGRLLVNHALNSVHPPHTAEK